MLSCTHLKLAHSLRVRFLERHSWQQPWQDIECPVEAPNSKSRREKFQGGDPWTTCTILVRGGMLFWLGSRQARETRRVVATAFKPRQAAWTQQRQHSTCSPLVSGRQTSCGASQETAQLQRHLRHRVDCQWCNRHTTQRSNIAQVVNIIHG